MGYAITPQISAFDTYHKPGEGVCVFFWDSDYDFFPAGIGSCLGYSNYKGAAAFENYNEPTHINGIRGGYIGVGFDVRGNFSNTTDGKTGTELLSSWAIPNTITRAVSTNAIGTVSPNSICVRAGELSAYKIISTTDNLSTFPIASNTNIYDTSPPVTFMQYVTSRDDVKFHKFKVALKHNGTRLEVSVKNPDSEHFYPYQVIDLDGDFTPDRLKAGLAVATGTSLMNCEIKNFAVYGAVSNATKVPDYNHLTPLSGSSLSVVAI